MFKGIWGLLLCVLWLRIILHCRWQPASCIKSILKELRAPKWAAVALQQITEPNLKSNNDIFLFAQWLLDWRASSKPKRSLLLIAVLQQKSRTAFVSMQPLSWTARWCLCFLSEIKLESYICVGELNGKWSAALRRRKKRRFSHESRVPDKNVLSSPDPITILITIFLTAW